MRNKTREKKELVSWGTTLIDPTAAIVHHLYFSKKYSYTNAVEYSQKFNAELIFCSGGVQLHDLWNIFYLYMFLEMTKYHFTRPRGSPVDWIQRGSFLKNKPWKNSNKNWKLVGGCGFNPSEKYDHPNGNLPQVGVKNKQYLKPAPRKSLPIQKQCDKPGPRSWYTSWVGTTGRSSSWDPLCFQTPAVTPSNWHNSL